MTENTLLRRFSPEERYMAFMLSTLNRMRSVAIYPHSYSGPYSRSAVIGTALKYAKHHPGICLEFGVHSGASLRLSATRLPDHHFFGFDSFEGFPEDGRPDWNKDFSIEPPSDLPSNCSLVKGWFDETLPPFLREHQEPVAFINIDCDIYSSTVTILTELEKAGRIGPGTIISFDELINYSTGLWNESLALFELMDRTGWGVEWLCVHQHVRGLEETLDRLSEHRYPRWKDDTQNGYLVQAALRIVERDQDMQILRIPHVASNVTKLSETYKLLTKAYHDGSLHSEFDSNLEKY